MLRITGTICKRNRRHNGAFIYALFWRLLLIRPQHCDRIVVATKPIQMKKLIRFIFIAAAATLPAVSAFAEPDQATQTIFKNLMAATVSNNYDAFIVECDAAMKGRMSKRMLERVSKELEPLAKHGYDAQYLGELNQHGNKVHLWRLKFKDGGDDVLATLSVKDGKAGNFLLQ